MLKAWLLLIAALLLNACAAAPAFKADKPATNPCEAITLRSYDKAFNATLAGEIDAAPASAEWPGVVADYTGLRDAVKACKGG